MYVDVVSAIGIWHMLRRIKANKGNTRDEFETRALTITGASFYLLAAGLAVTAAIDISTGHKPRSTRWGSLDALGAGLIGWLACREGREAFQKAHGAL